MKTLLTSLKIFFFFTALTGIVYPLFVTGLAQLVFPAKANGSLIMKNNKLIGSELIGQQFDSAIYFCSRPSAISYNPMPSGGSNFGLTNLKLKHLVNERANKFNAFNGYDSLNVVPSEMLFASGSGLDPHISSVSAVMQVERIVKARNLDNLERMKLMKFIHEIKEAPQFGFLGNERINVLALNIELDNLYESRYGIRK